MLMAFIHAEFENRGLMRTYYDWVMCHHWEESEQDPDEWFEDSEWMDFEHSDAIQFVITMEVSIFILRRTGGAWGESIDTLANNRVIYINQYREDTGYQINGTNEEFY